jgi:parallel beta-helix repeat protein
MSTRFPAVAAAVLAALVPAARAAAAIICANPAGGSPEGLACHTTIQAAVDAARRPTDVIRVTAGVYHEVVVVPPFKNGLQIVGDDGPAAILDVPEGQAVGITVMSPDIQIRTLTILNREVGVTLQAPRATLQGLRIAGGSGPAVATTGPSNAAHRMLENDVDSGFTLFGPDMVVQDNVVRAGQIRVFGLRGLVVGNRVTGGGIHVLDVDTGRTAVRSNVIRNADVGIEFIGRNPIVEGNRVEGAGLGIVVSCVVIVHGDPEACREGSISGNTVSGAARQGLFVAASAPGLPVRDNRAEGTGGVGVIGTGILLEHNVALVCSGPCYSLNGSAIHLERSSARLSRTTGVLVEGNNGAVADVVLADNVVLDNRAEGIAIRRGARNTTVRNNTGRHNRPDFCDEGVGTVVIDNRFDTVGPCSAVP